jgi:hypothetical protein
MKAVNGYIEDGFFIPLENISFKQRVSAVLVFNEVREENERERFEWLEQLDHAAEEAAKEEIPEFPRAVFNRKLVDIIGNEIL